MSHIIPLVRHLSKSDGGDSSIIEKARVNQWVEVEEQVSLVESDLVPYQVLVAKLATTVSAQGTLIAGKVWDLAFFISLGSHLFAGLLTLLFFPFLFLFL